MRVGSACSALCALLMSVLCLREAVLGPAPGTFLVPAKRAAAQTAGSPSGEAQRGSNKDKDKEADGEEQCVWGVIHRACHGLPSCIRCTYCRVAEGEDAWSWICPRARVCLHARDIREGLLPGTEDDCLVRVYCHNGLATVVDPALASHFREFCTDFAARTNPSSTSFQHRRSRTRLTFSSDAL